MSIVERVANVSRGTERDTIEDDQSDDNPSDRTIVERLASLVQAVIAADQPVDNLEDLSIGDDDLYKMLKNSRRRTIIRLVDEEDKTNVNYLARRIAAEENDKQPEALTSQERKRVYIALYQNHLPPLDKAGILTYNKPRGHVEATDETGRVAALLEIVDGARGESDE